MSKCSAIKWWENKLYSIRWWCEFKPILLFRETNGGRLWFLTPLLTIFHLYRGVNCIGGGNRCARRKQPTCQKSLTHFITWCIGYTPQWADSKWMSMMSALYYTNMLSWISIELAHWNNSPRKDISPHSDTFSWLQANQSFILFLNDTW